MDCVDKQRIGHTLLISVSGELDLVTAEAVRAAIDGELEDSTRLTNLVFDLGHVDFIDSSGLGMLLGRYKKIKQRGGQLRAFNVKPAVKRVLEMAGMNKIMNVAATKDQALADL